jgi:hypothetical protein
MTLELDFLNSSTRFFEVSFFCKPSPGSFRSKFSSSVFVVLFFRLSFLESLLRVT